MKRYYWTGEGSQEIRIIRRRYRRDKLTVLSYVLTVFLGAPLVAVFLWVLLEMASKP